MDELQVPEGLRPMATQVAGHTFQTNSKDLGLLQDPASGCVLKPLGKPACGKRELGFYETLLCTDDSVIVQLRPLVPKFHHKVKLTINCREQMFLKLEDLTYAIDKPCIMDIKIGRKTWDPLATPQKRAIEEQKYVMCKQSLGLCVPGFQMYSVAGGNVLRHGKEFGKQMDVKCFHDTMALFFNTKPKVCIPLIKEVLKQLYAIRNWFSVQTILNFYASSLLIVYDCERLRTYLSMNEGCDPLTNGNVDNKDRRLIEHSSCEHTVVKPILPDPTHWVKVRMIDFAHVFPTENGALDTNYLFGLENFIDAVEQLLIR